MSRKSAVFEIWGVTPWNEAAEEGDEACELGVIGARSESEAIDAWLNDHPADANDFETIVAVER